LEGRGEESGNSRKGVRAGWSESKGGWRDKGRDKLARVSQQREKAGHAGPESQGKIPMTRTQGGGGDKMQTRGNTGELVAPVIIEGNKQRGNFLRKWWVG